MKKMALFILCLIAFAPSSTLFAHQKAVKIGNFNIDLITHSKFLLDDGNCYKPDSKHAAKSTRDWQLGDKIIVLTSKHTNRYTLINTRTNTRVLAKIVDLGSSS